MSEKEKCIVPKCMKMCPSTECSQRLRLNLIDPLETDLDTLSGRKLANPNKMIKSYCRSAAGQNLCRSELIRPPGMLMKTVSYILKNIINDRQSQMPAIYDFVNDRFRSVKQDGVIQRLSADDWFLILPPVIRFYAFSAYWLCEEPIHCFDPKLNRTQLLDCILLLIRNHEFNPISKVSEIRAEVEALYLIIDPNHETINRAVMLDLPNPPFQETLKLILKWYTRDYVAVLRKLLKLPLLTSCLFCALHLTKTRKNILQIMSSAYCCKNMQYPVSKLTSDLLYDSTEEAISELTFYGIPVSSDNCSINFKKITFPANQASSKRIKALDDRFVGISLQNLLMQNDRNQNNSLNK